MLPLVLLCFLSIYSLPSQTKSWLTHPSPSSGTPCASLRIHPVSYPLLCLVVVRLLEPARSQRYSPGYCFSCWWKDLNWSPKIKGLGVPISTPNDSWLCSRHLNQTTHISFTAETSLLLKNLKFRQDNHVAPSNITLTYCPQGHLSTFQLWVRLQNLFC